MKTRVLTIAGVLSGVSSYAQEITPVEKYVTGDPFNHPMLPLFLIYVLLGISIMLVIVIGIFALRIMNVLNEQVEKEKAQKVGMEYVPAPGWWTRFTQTMNASVPVEREKEIVLEHSYDGIRELDNHLPPWWKWLFYGTIVWAVVYIIVFHFTDTLPLSIEEYRIEVAQAEEHTRQLRASQPAAEAIDENTLAFINDAAIIEKGKKIFANNPCGSCHRNDGGGNTIGPNLTDEYWIHGGDVKNVFNVVKNGAVDKGMPAWGKTMSSQDLRDLTFFIMSLQGTNPPEGKSPQGDLFKKIPSLKTDSTHTQASL